MKINWNYIKMIALFLLVVFLYAFSSARNAKRIVSKPEVQFIGNKNLLYVDILYIYGTGLHVLNSMCKQ